MTAKHRPGTLGGALSELRKGTFFTNASLRLSRRKSRWNLLLFLCVPMWLFLFLGSLHLVTWAERVLIHGAVNPDHWPWLRAFAPFFMNFPLLLATVLPSMVIVNFLIYTLVPPARRAMDAEDRAFPGTEYATAQPELVRLSIIVLPVALLLALFGATFQ